MFASHSQALADHIPIEIFGESVEIFRSVRSPINHISMLVYVQYKERNSGRR